MYGNKGSFKVMEKPNVGIVTIPISEAGVMPLSNLVDLVSSFSAKICLVTGDAGYTSFKDNDEVRLYGVDGSFPRAGEI